MVFWKKRRRSSDLASLHPVIVQMTHADAQALVRFIEKRWIVADVAVVNRLHHGLKRSVEMEGLVLQSWVNLSPVGLEDRQEKEKSAEGFLTPKVT